MPPALVPFQSHEREAYNGLCLVILRSLAGEVGEAVLNVTAEGLPDTQVHIQVVADRK